MAVKFSCACGKQIVAPDERAGESVRCPECGNMVQVPGVSLAETETPSPGPGPSRGPGPSPGPSPLPRVPLSPSLTEFLSRSGTDLPTVVLKRADDDLAGVRELIEGANGAKGPGQERLGRYPALGSLGRGGMGEVLLVRDPEIGRDLAAKVILGGTLADQKALEKFLVEAQVTGQLEHPNIVPVHELDVAPDGRVYFTMKRVRGKDLEKVLREEATSNSDTAREREHGHGHGHGTRSTNTDTDTDKHKGEDGAYSLVRLLEVFLKVCDAVAFAHAMGVTHRDLKPANVMVGEFGEVLVMDWGLAKVRGHADRAAAQVTPDLSGAEVARRARGRAGADEEPLRTMAGSIVGTPAYMSPEQARGDIEALDERSDVYSLGAILFQILTLSRPFTGGNVWMILHKVMQGELVPPSERAPERHVPRELEAAVLKAMAKSPARRYASVAGLRADIEAYLGGRTLAAARYTPWQRAWKLAMRHKAASSVAAAALLLVAFFVGWLAVERGRAIEARDAEAAAGKLALEKSREAEEQAGIADAQRQEAQRQAGIADGQRREAERQAGIAEEKRQEATLRLGDALEDKARLALERKRTSEALVLAQRAIAIRDTPASRTLLANVLQELWRSRRLSGHEAAISVVAWSPDGKRLASGSYDNTIRLRDGETGRAIATLEGHRDDVNSIAFSPDGKRLASGSDDNTVRLWDGETGRAIATLEGHGDIVWSVAFSPDGKILASGSNDKTVRLWDGETGRSVATLGGHAGWVTSVAFSPDGNRLASGSYDNTVRLWDGEGANRVPW
ncbi:MAG: protein kinase [Planctomycetes bacterium]|nr:protein kinase [Planctomycetota bacterium]